MSDRLFQKIDTFIDIVQQIAQLSTSSRLKVGAIAVKRDFQKIASFGYNGNYTGAPINQDTGTEEESLEPGQDGFIHAEINLIAKFREDDPENYIILLSHSPCKMCTKVLINAGFKYIYWLEEYRDINHLSLLERPGMYSGNKEDLKSDVSYIQRL